jgi:hypothetical protein
LCAAVRHHSDQSHGLVWWSGINPYFIDSQAAAAAFPRMAAGAGILAAACHIPAGADRSRAVVGARKPQAVVVAAVRRYNPPKARPTLLRGLNAKASFVTPLAQARTKF